MKDYLVALTAAAAVITTVATSPLWYPTQSILNSHQLKNGNGRPICTVSHIGNGEWLTAAHCVNRGITGLAIDGRYPIEKTIHLDFGGDYATLYAPGTETLPVADVSCREPVLGEELHHWGTPTGIYDVHSWGRVALDYVRPIAQWKRATMVGFAASHGSSGAPVFRGTDIVGIVVGGPTPFGGMTIVVPLSHTKLCGYSYKTEPEMP